MLGNSAAVSKRSEVKYCASAIPRPRPLARTLLTVGATSIGVAVASLALQLGRGLQKETVTLSGPGLQGVRRPMKRLLSWAESLPSLRDNKIPMTFELRDEPARPHLLVQLPHLISSAELIAGTRTRESETLNPAGTPPQMNRIGRIGSPLRQMTSQARTIATMVSPMAHLIISRATRVDHLTSAHLLDLRKHIPKTYL